MTINIEMQTIVKRGKEILFSQLDDALLAIDADDGYCYGLNETAGRVWEIIATPQPVAAVCTQLCNEYTVDETTCLREVIALLQHLIAAGLVQVVDVAIN